jgi:hypothetical protein
MQVDRAETVRRTRKAKDKQRMSNTWGKQKVQNKAATDIEKGTCKGKAEEDTEKTAEAAARRHARGCTRKA